MKALIFLAVMVIAALVVFPLLFGPGVAVPSEVFPGNPFLLEVKLSNENITPLTDVEYTCQAVDVELASGVQVKDAKVLNQGRIRKFQGRRAISARCETAYLIDAPLKKLEFKLSLKYRAYPWPVDQTREYRFAATIDGQGRLTGWVQK